MVDPASAAAILNAALNVAKVIAKATGAADRISHHFGAKVLPTPQEQFYLNQGKNQERQIALSEMLREDALKRNFQEMEQKALFHREGMEESRRKFIEQIQVNKELESYKRQLGMWDTLLSLTPENVIERCKEHSPLNVFLFNRDANDVAENAIRQGIEWFFFGTDYPDIIVHHKSGKLPFGNQTVATTLWSPLRYENGLILWIDSIPSQRLHRVYVSFWIKSDFCDTQLSEHSFEVRYGTDDKAQQANILNAELKQCILYVADLVAFFSDVLHPRLPRLLNRYPEGFLDKDEAYPIVKALRKQHRVLLPIYNYAPDVGADFSLKLAASMLDGKHIVAAREHLFTTAHWLAQEKDYELSDGTLKDPASSLRKIRGAKETPKGREISRNFETLLARAGYEISLGQNVFDQEPQRGHRYLGHIL